MSDLGGRWRSRRAGSYLSVSGGGFASGSSAHPSLSTRLRRRHAAGATAPGALPCVDLPISSRLVRGQTDRHNETSESTPEKSTKVPSRWCRSLAHPRR